MALSLNVHNKANLNAIDSSYLGMNNGFIVYLCNNSFWLNHKAQWRIPTTSFTGIMLENLSIDFNIPWGDAAGAVIGEKVEKAINNKLFSILAGQSDKGYQPFIASDAWTQMKVKGESEPIKISLKFKAYNVDRLQCTNYNDIIRFLIHITSPIYSAGPNGDTNPGVFGQVTDRLTNSIYGIKNLGGVAKGGLSNAFAAGKDFIKAIGNDSINDALVAGAKIVDTADAIYKTIIQNGSSGKNNGNFTVNFSIGDISKNDIKNPNTNEVINPDAKINRRYIETNQMLSNGSVENRHINIDWIVKSFTFTPSKQFEMINGLPKPLWMNFDLSLETRLSLSNRYVYDILLPNMIKIVKN